MVEKREIRTVARDNAQLAKQASGPKRGDERSEE
jgi:hypothetical protein